MRVLGIDPGTATTGWGVVEFRDGKISCIDFGCIRTHAKEAKAERLIKNHLSQFIAHNKAIQT